MSAPDMESAMKAVMAATSGPQPALVDFELPASQADAVEREAHQVSAPRASAPKPPEPRAPVSEAPAPRSAASPPQTPGPSANAKAESNGAGQESLLDAEAMAAALRGIAAPDAPQTKEPASPAEPVEKRSAPPAAAPPRQRASAKPAPAPAPAASAKARASTAPATKRPPKKPMPSVRPVPDFSGLPPAMAQSLARLAGVPWPPPAQGETAKEERQLEDETVPAGKRGRDT
jgi:hypothetical protein